MELPRTRAHELIILGSSSLGDVEWSVVQWHSELASSSNIGGHRSQEKKLQCEKIYLLKLKLMKNKKFIYLKSNSPFPPSLWAVPSVPLKLIKNKKNLFTQTLPPWPVPSVPLLT